jgi:hypothetical protein
VTHATCPVALAVPATGSPGEHGGQTMITKFDSSYFGTVDMKNEGVSELLICYPV